jgi:hypothetical protein
MSTINKEREDLESLLPWHAAGTLSRRDAERVEKALAGDRDLARHLELVREELHETIHLNESLGAPSARAMEKLFAAIDAEPARRAKVSFDLAGRLAGFMASLQPRTLAWAASGAFIAIVAMGSVITTDLVKRELGQGVELASNQVEVSQPGLASAEVRDGSLAAIRFTPKAEAAEITKFLLANNASVVDGPTTGGGMYTIRLPETGKAKEDHIKQMQAQTAIVEIIAPKQ